MSTSGITAVSPDQVEQIKAITQQLSEEKEVSLPETVDHQSLLLKPKLSVFGDKLSAVYKHHNRVSTKQEKLIINPLRFRQPEDSLEKCMKSREIPAVVQKRDHYEEIDLVFNTSVAKRIVKSEHGMVSPWFIKTQDEEIRVTCAQVDHHFKTKQPYFLSFQRYIVGQPNLLCLPLTAADQSISDENASRFQFSMKHLWVWCYNDDYQSKIEVDCNSLTKTMHQLKVADIEKMLPYGMYLHDNYKSQMFHTVAKLIFDDKEANSQKQKAQSFRPDDFQQSSYDKEKNRRKQEYEKTIHATRKRLSDVKGSSSST